MESTDKQIGKLKSLLSFLTSMHLINIFYSQTPSTFENYKQTPVVNYQTSVESAKKVDSRANGLQITISKFDENMEGAAEALQEINPTLGQLKLNMAAQVEDSSEDIDKVLARAKKPRAKKASVQKEEGNHRPSKKRAVKLVRKATESTSANDDFEETKVKMLACKTCKKLFTAQGLGGHRAKAHPMQNHDYQEKIKKREQNKPRLNLLRMAQLKYYETVSTKIPPNLIPRQIINRYKQEIEADPDFMSKLSDKDEMERIKAAVIEKKILYGNVLKSNKRQKH